MHSPFIVGRKVYLRPLEREDHERSLTWVNDREVTRYLVRGTFPLSRDLQERQLQANAQRQDEFELAIVTKQGDHSIGIVGLHNLSWIPRSVEFRILVGERKFWGQGIGTEVAQLMVAYAFEVLNIHRVWLGVNAENTSALRSYMSAGFVREGVLRDEVFRNGRYYDVIRMAMLEPEYRTAVKKWSLLPQICSQFLGPDRPRRHKGSKRT